MNNKLHINYPLWLDKFYIDSAKFAELVNKELSDRFDTNGIPVAYGSHFNNIVDYTAITCNDVVGYVKGITPVDTGVAYLDFYWLDNDVIKDLDDYHEGDKFALKKSREVKDRFYVCPAAYDIYPRMLKDKLICFDMVDTLMHKRNPFINNTPRVELYDTPLEKYLLSLSQQEFEDFLNLDVHQVFKALISHVPEKVTLMELGKSVELLETELNILHRWSRDLDGNAISTGQNEESHLDK